MTMETKWYHGVKWGYRPAFEAMGRVIAWNIGPVTEHSVDVRGTAKDREEIAELFASAPETATQRDKLLSDNQGLREALAKARASIKMACGFSTLTGHDYDFRPTVEMIDAALSISTGGG